MIEIPKTQILRFSFNELAVSQSEIENLLGITEENAIEPFDQYIKEVLEIAENLQHICAAYVVFDKIFLDFESNTSSINGTFFNTGKIVTRQLKKSSSIALFVCTAGNELEEFSRQQMKIGNMPEGYIADLAGSLIVEAAMDKAQAFLAENQLSQGLVITNRYSPGYCGWNVVEQQKLFGLLPDGICNIRLTESSLMQPIKSVSGMIGIGAEVKFNPYTCQICEMKDCMYRNRKHQHTN